jgi:mRNA interferase RelE/StbE
MKNRLPRGIRLAMPIYKLRIPADIAAVIRHMHPQLKQKIRAALRIIQNEPKVGKGLKEELAGLRSFRVNRFRIVYQIVNDAPQGVLEIAAIGPRPAIYEETLRLIR